MFRPSSISEAIISVQFHWKHPKHEIVSACKRYKMNSQIPLPISISIFSIFQSSQIAPKLQPIACEAKNKTNIKTHALLFTIRISKLLVICVAVTSPRRRWVGLSATFTRKQTLLSLTQTSFLNLKKMKSHPVYIESVSIHQIWW